MLCSVARPIGNCVEHLVDDPVHAADSLPLAQPPQIAAGNSPGFPHHPRGAEARGQRIGREGHVKCRRQRPRPGCIHQERVIAAVIVVIGGCDVEYRTAENFLHCPVIGREGAGDFHQLGVFESVP